MRNLPKNVNRSLNLLVDHAFEREFDNYLKNSPLPEKESHIFFAIKTVVDYLERSGQLDSHNRQTLSRVRGPLRAHWERHAWSRLREFAELVEERRAADVSRRSRRAPECEHEPEGRPQEPTEAEHDWSR